MTPEAETVRVLHVDDDAAFVDMAAEFLEREDDRINVRTTTSVEAGLDVLAEREIDCVVSDYEMPETDGIDFLKAVREEYGDLPFVLYTGKGSEEVAGDAIAAGVTHYLQKGSGTEQYAVLANRVLSAVRASRAQRERERQLDAIETAQEGISILDEDGRFVYVNEAYAELYGYDSDDLIGEHWELLYRDEDVQRIHDDILPTVEESGRWHGTTTGLRVDGSTFLEDHVLARTDRGELICTVRNVTDRRRRERVLRDMYDVISDRDQSFEEQVSALLELGREELEAEYGTLSEIRGEDYVFEVVAADDDSIRAGDVVPVSATNCEIAASTEQTLVLGDVARDAPGETDRAGYTDWGIACYIGAPVIVDDEVYGTFCFYDTEARAGQFSEWEETLVDLMSGWVSYELERRQANRRLQARNEQLAEFASVVSHDLRNPLNVAEGQLDLAIEEYGSEHLEEVARAHDRMSALIDDLLTLARQGERVGETEPVDLGELARNCWRNVDAPAATVRTDADRRIRADPGRLQQVLENLMRNAVEHGDDGVTVTVGELEEGFYVEDDGPGIPAGDREDVFRAGYSTSQDGTGFGLSIVKRIAEAHGWELHLTEGTGGGARFEVTGVEFDPE